MRSSEALEAGLLARLPLSWAHGIFTPNALLDAGRASEFVQLLNMLAEVNAELLDDEDIGTLLAAFDVGRYLDGLQLPASGASPEQVEALKGGEELTVLALTTERLLCSSRLRPLGLTSVSYTHLTLPTKRIV